MNTSTKRLHIQTPFCFKCVRPVKWQKHALFLAPHARQLVRVRIETPFGVKTATMSSVTSAAKRFNASVAISWRSAETVLSTASDCVRGAIAGRLSVCSATNAQNAIAFFVAIVFSATPQDCVVVA